MNRDIFSEGVAVTAIVDADDDGLWVGTCGEGLHLIMPKDRLTIDVLRSVSVVSDGLYAVNERLRITAKAVNWRQPPPTTFPQMI